MNLQLNPMKSLEFGPGRRLQGTRGDCSPKPTMRKSNAASLDRQTFESLRFMVLKLYYDGL